MSWVLAFHVIFVVIWFSGLFYLPRLFVYHATCEDTPGQERFKIMERKLYIMSHIGAIGTAVFGLWLLIAYAYTTYSSTTWLWVKLFFVLLLYGFHLYCGRLVKNFRENKNIKGHVYYRLINELPVLPLFVIVILVIVKPF
ncbi:MAG: CopD family protein [Thiohalomonadales bacterium]